MPIQLQAWWTPQTGAATVLSVWVVGRDEAEGGYGVHRWDGTNWQPAGGGAVRIAVGPRAQAWIVNNVGTIFARTSPVLVRPDA